MTIQGIAAATNVPPGATAPTETAWSDRTEDTLRQLDELSWLPAVEIHADGGDATSAVPLTIGLSLGRDQPRSDFIEQLLALITTIADRSVLSVSDCRRLLRLAAHCETVRQAAFDIRHGAN